MNTSNAKIGQYELIISDLINNNAPYRINNNSKCHYSEYQKNKLIELKKNIDLLNNRIITTDYNTIIMDQYVTWINKVKSVIINKINKNDFYSFYKFKSNYMFYDMEDYYDVPETDKLFSFSLFISNYENLSYLIGLVYNYSIIKKHYPDYKLRLYIDFHSVFGSPETFNVFNMFLDILKNIDPEYDNTLQMIVFFLNPFYNINNESIYESIIDDTEEVKKYYINILFNTSNMYIKSPLLATCKNNNTSNTVDNNNTSKTIDDNNTKNIVIDEEQNILNLNIDTMEITYNKVDKIIDKTKFYLFSCHVSVNLRFLPIQSINH
jgi:hypothetical protein